MDDYDGDGDDAFGCGEPSLSFAVASTPLSELGGGNYDNDDELDDQEGDDDDQAYDDSMQVQDRFVQPDGSIVIVMRASNKAPRKQKKKTAPTKSGSGTQAVLGLKAVKFTALAANAMATAITPRDLVHAPGAIQTDQWSAGLCDCWEFCMPNCCMATFCPCITAAQIATRIGFRYSSVLLVFAFVVGIDLLTYALTLSTMNHNDSYAYYSRGRYYTYRHSTKRLTVWGYIAIAATTFTLLAFLQLRTKVRDRFRLPGSVVDDFCVSVFCSCCSLAQMATHVKSYKPGSCDFGPPDELPAYTA